MANSYVYNGETIGKSHMFSTVLFVDFIRKENPNVILYFRCVVRTHAYYSGLGMVFGYFEASFGIGLMVSSTKMSYCL
jgi:hypothetical protein